MNEYEGVMSVEIHYNSCYGSLHFMITVFTGSYECHLIISALRRRKLLYIYQSISSYMDICFGTLAYVTSSCKVMC